MGRLVLDFYKLHVIARHNKAIKQITLRPRCLLPSPPFQSILNDLFCSERVTMHCEWGGKSQYCPFPLGFRHPAGRGPSQGSQATNTKNCKDHASGSDMCSRTDRQTHRQTWSSQYFAKQPDGITIIQLFLCFAHSLSMGCEEGSVSVHNGN